MVAHHTPKNEPHARTFRTLFRMDLKDTRATKHFSYIIIHLYLPWGQLGLRSGSLHFSSMIIHLYQTMGTAGIAARLYEQIHT